MKKIDIREYKISELLEMLDEGEASILKDLGAAELLYKMKLLGFALETFIKLICAERDDTKVRARGTRMISAIAPYELVGEFVKTDEAIAIGFNHPSLGEIFRLLALAFENYSDRELLFPVTLPWYECLVASIPRLKRLGVTLVPMVTPSTEKKLNKLFDGDEQKADLIRYLKNMLERNYMRTAASFSEKGGIIFVAPSTTRQEKIIGEHVHPTMTLLGHVVFRSKEVHTVFQPVAVIPTEKHTKGVNFFKEFKIAPCEPFDSDTARRLTERGREFDMIFLKRILEKYNTISDKPN